MKTLPTALAALALTFVGVPVLTSSAVAHQAGPVCRYQSIDRYGNVRAASDYCHNLPARYQQRPPSGFTLYFHFGDGFYFDDHPRRVKGRRGNRGQEHVCLVTFFKRNQVEGGADANVQRARYLPRHTAERIDGPRDRHRIFDYGSNKKTRQTCRYLHNINN